MNHLFTTCLALLMLLSSTANGQGQDPIQQFYKKYRQVENVTHVSVGGLLLNLATTFSQEREAKELLARVRRVRVLTVPDPEIVPAEELLSLRQGVLGSGFEELIMVRDEGSLVHIYMQENTEEVIERVFITVEEADELTLVSLSGKLRYDDLQHLDLGGPGGEALRQVENP